MLFNTYVRFIRSIDYVNDEIIIIVVRNVHLKFIDHLFNEGLFIYRYTNLNMILI